MNHEDNGRIKLKVLTTTGINILCTALKGQKISQWLPHFQEAYREVKEEQGDDQHSRQTFIRAVRVKKEDYYIANSQVIGDVFVDNDEVCCEIVGEGGKKKNKAEKQKRKKEGQRERVQQTTQVKEERPVHNEQNKSKEKQQTSNKNSDNSHHKEPVVKTPIKQTPSKPKHTDSQNNSNSPKAHILHKVDLSKLKNLLVKQQHHPSPLRPLDEQSS